MTKPRVLVAGPYVGEFGWECFSWQPQVRSAFLQNRMDRCLSFTGPGRRWLYRFAETRALSGMPKHEAECLGWANMPAHRADMEALMRRTTEAAKAELPGAEMAMMNASSLPSLADPAYGRGQPDLLYPDPSPRLSRFWRGGGSAAAGPMREGPPTGRPPQLAVPALAAAVRVAARGV